MYMYVYMHRAYMNIQSNIPRGNTFVQYTCTLYMNNHVHSYTTKARKKGKDVD